MSCAPLHALFSNSRVEPIFAAVGESDRDQARTTPSGAPDAAIHPTLERHLDFDVEDFSLQPPGHLLEPLAHKLDGTSAPLVVRGHDARVGIGGQTGDEVTAVSVNGIKELAESVVERRGHQRFTRDSFLRAAKTGQRAFASGSEPYPVWRLRMVSTGAPSRASRSPWWSLAAAFIAGGGRYYHRRRERVPAGVRGMVRERGAATEG